MIPAGRGDLERRVGKRFGFGGSQLPQAASAADFFLTPRFAVLVFPPAAGVCRFCYGGAYEKGRLWCFKGIFSGNTGIFMGVFAAGRRDHRECALF